MIDLLEHQGDKAFTPSSMESGTLVRDRVGRGYGYQQWNRGEYIITELQDDDLAEYWLCKKLLEETHGVIQAFIGNDYAGVAEKMGDLTDVLDFLQEVALIDVDDINMSRSKKLAEEGSFSEMILVKRLK